MGDSAGGGNTVDMFLRVFREKTRTLQNTITQMQHQTNSITWLTNSLAPAVATHCQHSRRLRFALDQRQVFELVASQRPQVMRRVECPQRDAAHRAQVQQVVVRDAHP